MADVTQQPLETQIALVDRLEKELQQGLDPADGIDLSEARQEVADAECFGAKAVVVRRTSTAISPPGESAARTFHGRAHRDRVGLVELGNRVADRRTSGPGAASAVAEFFEEIETWMNDETDIALQAKMETAVREGVVRWLVKQSLTQQPMSVRTELATRIARHLDAGFQVSELQDAKPAEATMLRENCELLMEAWLRQQAPRLLRAAGLSSNLRSSRATLKAFRTGACWNCCRIRTTTSRMRNRVCCGCSRSPNSGSNAPQASSARRCASWFRLCKRRC